MKTQSNVHRMEHSLPLDVCIKAFKTRTSASTLNKAGDHSVTDITPLSPIFIEGMGLNFWYAILHIFVTMITPQKCTIRQF
jgi:hypothetical protein